ncbi:MAG: DUF1573 domain-containing protein [Armatimonadota bacterium]|nr:MAG: DUF1573 domain-containing protein [Armatimonadota bacterium]
MLMGDPVEHDFVFRNTGTAPLIIGDVKTSCGCTAALVTDKEVPPGGEGRVKATFRTTNYKGTQRKSIYVETNDPEQSQVTLRLNGEVKAQIEATPSLIYESKLAVGESVTRTVTVSGVGGYVFQIEKVSAAGAGIRVSEPRSVPGGKYEIDVTVKPVSATSSVTGMVTIETDSERQPKVHVSVRANIATDK